MKAKRILEIGTSFGYSTIWLAMVAKEEKGKVITVDRLPEKVAIAYYTSAVDVASNVTSLNLVIKKIQIRWRY